MSQYRDSSSISYRPVNFFGLLLSGGTLATIILQLQHTDVSCPLCSLVRLVLLSTATLFLLAWLHNPRTFGQRVYNTLNLLMVSIGLAAPGQYLWLRSQGNILDCSAPLASQLELLANLLPNGAQLLPRTLATADCYMSDVRLFGLGLPEVSLAIFGLLLVLTVKQLRKKRSPRSLFN